MNKIINEKKTVLRYIVPFYVETKNKINNDYEILISKLDKHGYKIIEDKDSEKDLYEYIYDQIGRGNDTKELGCVYEKNNINSAAYENTYFDIMSSGDRYKGIYFAITDKDDGYVIHIDYDIDSIL